LAQKRTCWGYFLAFFTGLKKFLRVKFPLQVCCCLVRNLGKAFKSYNYLGASHNLSPGGVVAEDFEEIN